MVLNFYSLKHFKYFISLSKYSHFFHLKINFLIKFSCNRILLEGCRFKRKKGDNHAYSQSTIIYKLTDNKFEGN